MPEVQEVLPKYLQVAAFYREQILSGALTGGDELPSERHLATLWGISRPTATRALAALRNQGLAEARQGSGTYVRDQSVLNRRASDRYMRSRTTGQIYAPGERAEILEAGRSPLPDWVVEVHRLAPGQQGVGRRRLTLEKDEPVEVSTSWFTDDVVLAAPQLLDVTRIREGTVAYVERATGRSASYARDQLSARLATVRERSELKLSSRQAAVLVVHHTVFDADDAAIECVEAVYPPDRWTFHQEYRIH
jgi:DNA-binding GntR family transcriptional regulator